MQVDILANGTSYNYESLLQGLKPIEKNRFRF